MRQDKNRTVAVIQNERQPATSNYQIDVKINPPQQFTVKSPATRVEACDYLNISLPTLSKLLKEGKIPCFNIGRSIRINWTDLEAFITNRGIITYSSN